MLFFLIILFLDLTTYDSVKHFLLLNTPLVDNSLTHSVARCRIPNYIFSTMEHFWPFSMICLSVPAESLDFGHDTADKIYLCNYLRISLYKRHKTKDAALDTKLPSLEVSY